MTGVHVAPEGDTLPLTASFIKTCVWANLIQIGDVPRDGHGLGVSEGASCGLYMEVIIKLTCDPDGTSDDQLSGAVPPLLSLREVIQPHCPIARMPRATWLDRHGLLALFALHVVTGRKGQ